MKFDLRGLYAITDTRPEPAVELASRVEAALRGGARAVQYRYKGNDEKSSTGEARVLVSLCREYRVPLIINDNLELAARIGADGVHLGRDDASPATAREFLGTAAVIGISCYNDLELALKAEAAGADYVAFGRFFPSASKPNAVKAEADLLRRARSRLSLPIVAIGGITSENGRRLIDAGADMLAVIHGIFAQPDITAASHKIAALFEQEDT